MTTSNVEVLAHYHNDSRQNLRNYLSNVRVPDQVRTLSQEGTEKISKGGWAILELFEPYRNHDLKFSFSK